MSNPISKPELYPREGYVEIEVDGRREYAETEYGRVVNATSISFVTLAESGEIDETTMTENIDFFADWDYPIKYKKGNIRRDPLDGNLYETIQEHTSETGWNPSLTPALWKKKGDPSEEWPDWSQPTGANDSYALGAKVTHSNRKWISDYDANVWEPGVFGWTEYIEEGDDGENV